MEELGGEGHERVGLFAGKISDRASMPDLSEFIDDRDLPSAERGPVDFCALRRLASI